MIPAGLANTGISYLYPMPFQRNFTYSIDKRKWKYIFLVVSLELGQW